MAREVLPSSVGYVECACALCSRGLLVTRGYGKTLFDEREMARWCDLVELCLLFHSMCAGHL